MAGRRKPSKRRTQNNASKSKKEKVADLPPVVHDSSDSDLDMEDAIPDEIEEDDIIEDNDDDKNLDDDETDAVATSIFRAGLDKLEDGEELDYNPSTYKMLHRFNYDWPCLSFDILKDGLGSNRKQYPHTMYVATGTQADSFNSNRLVLLKLSDLCKTKFHENGTSSDEEDDDDNDDEPILEARTIKHEGAVNRIRSCPQKPSLVATMSESKKAHIWDVSQHWRALDGTYTSAAVLDKVGPTFTFNGHPDEGYALEWSPHKAGNLVTGDCSKFIYEWHCMEGTWGVDAVPYVGHDSSVEDIKWSPAQESVFMSCSVDRHVAVWDTRAGKKPVAKVKAHDDDINVISWNTTSGSDHTLATGCDDGTFRIWDLRQIQDNTGMIAHFKHHNLPITSIEFSPYDPNVLGVSSADNVVSLWDLSVESDESTPDNLDVPPQLMFEHMGQRDVKEIHWHPQIPNALVTTAADGFNVIQPDNLKLDSDCDGDVEM